MVMTTNEKISLQNMIELCRQKFGDISCGSVVYDNGCDGCTGSCSGHGASVWTACDIK